MHRYIKPASRAHEAGLSAPLLNDDSLLNSIIQEQLHKDVSCQDPDTCQSLAGLGKD